MIKIVQNIIVSSLIMMIIVPIGWYSSVFYLQTKTKKLYEKACIEYHKKYFYVLINYKEGIGLDQAIYCRDKECAKELPNYYRQTYDFYNKLNSNKSQIKWEISESGDTTGYIVPIHFPNNFKYTFVGHPVYIKNYNIKDSIMKALFFDTACWGYFEAYVTPVTLHDNPPPDSLLKEFERRYEGLPVLRKGDSGYPIGPYGLHCY